MHPANPNTFSTPLQVRPPAQAQEPIPLVVLQERLRATSLSDNEPSSSDESFTDYQLRRLRGHTADPQDEFQNPTFTRIPVKMSKSLMNDVSMKADRPNFTHVGDARINYELDALAVIFDTLNDSEGKSSERAAKINEFIHKRAATIRIGGSLGFHTIPGSNLVQDFQTLGLDASAAQIAASSAHVNQPFRSAPTGGARGGFRKKSKSRSKK